MKKDTSMSGSVLVHQNHKDVRGINKELHPILEELKQYKLIVESTQNPIAVIDKDYKFQYVNGAYLEFFQKSVDDIMGLSVSDFLGHKLFQKTLRLNYDRCFTGESVNYLLSTEFPQIGHRCLDVRYSPLRNENGEIYALVSNIHDVTSSKELEIKIEDSEKRFQAFMENVPAYVYIKDENDRHIYVNSKTLTVIGKSSEEIVGRTTSDIFPSEVAATLIKKDKAVFADNTPMVVDAWQLSEDRGGQWIKDIKFPINLATGKNLLGGIAVDITDIKVKEQQLEEALKEITALKEQLSQENIILRNEIDKISSNRAIIGESTGIKENLEQAQHVAKENTTILILGETGTGKELLAQAIHDMSPRRNKLMIKVNCAALPANLIESELFGREKGAYTGAMTYQKGRFETADGSTIFLDEIGDLPIELQSKLLRVLQEGSFERLGSSQTTTVDVRVIAATNHNLKLAVKEGRFRKDLFYRLNVFPITVPPLTDRRDDIPIMVWSFVNQYNTRMGKSITTVTKEDMDQLITYSWPGNVRELKNIIERSMIMSSGSILKVVKIETEEIEEEITTSLPQKLVSVEKNHIRKVLVATGWRVSGNKGAAAILGLKATTLEARMKKLGIIRPV